ncbi:MAG: hypothetical protein CYPHOPRED_000437 [Cyphobasidiales sp. Tagirdzhanova-0007]|nr:MAG: hypothetical protein CYPHOPRED_000437 [Cyphobasidiales sp. Tagirdzhanova-0007]
MVVRNPAGSLNQTWNASAPINVSESNIISNVTTALNLYPNGTSNATTIQIYVDFCTSDQNAGLMLYSELVAGYLNGLNTLFVNAITNVTMPANSTILPAPGPMSSLQSSTSSAVAPASTTTSSMITSSTASSTSTSTTTSVSSIATETSSVPSAGDSSAASVASSLSAASIASSLLAALTSAP